MPREIVHDPTPEYQPFRLAVGWQRDMEVQLGMQSVDSDRHILDVLYLDNAYLERIGMGLQKVLNEVYDYPTDFTSSEHQREWRINCGRTVLGWVKDARTDVIERDGIWVTLPRASINETIRHLRRARDAAYGRDE